MTTPARNGRVSLVEFDGLAQALFEGARDPAFVFDVAGGIVAANGAACLLTGYDRDELLSMSVPDLVDEAGLDTCRERYARVLAGEDTVTRGAVCRKDGGRVEVEISSRALTVGGETLVHTTVRDVSEEVRRQLELESSEARFRELVENLNDVVYRVGLDGVIEYLSPPVATVLGYPPGDLVGVPYQELVHPDDVERIRQAFSEVLAGRFEPREYRMRHRDGSWRWVRTSSRPAIEGGASAGLQGVLTDVTARRRSELGFRTALENVALVAVMLDAEGRVAFVNDFTLHLTGWSRNEVEGTEWFERFVPEGARARVREVFHATFADGAIPPHFENPILTRQGDERPVLWSNTVLRDAEGRVTHTVSLGEDISERVRAEAALRESEARYRSLFESMRQGAFHQMADGGLADVNPAALEMFGLTREEFLGRTSEHPEWDAILPDGSVLPPERHPSMAALRTGDDVRDVVAGVLNPRTGGRVWMVINATPEFRPGEAAPYRVAVTLHDITDQKRAEDALRRSEGHLARAQTVAHVGSWSFDPATGKPWWSEEMFRIFGLDPLAGAPTYEQHRRLIHEDDWDVFDASVQEAMHSGASYDLQLRIVRPDGEVRTVRAQCLPRSPGADPPFHLDGATQDITERVRAETALRKSERRFRTLFERATVGIFTTRSTGEVLMVNPAMARMLGFASPEEALGHYTNIGLELYADPARRERLLQLLAADGEVEGFEYEARRVDGTTVWLSMNARIADRAADGSFVLEGFTTDVTQRVRAEEKLRASRRLLAETQAVSKVGGWEYDVGTGRVSWTDEVFSIYGVGAGHDPSDMAAAVDPYPGDAGTAIETLFRRALEDGTPYDVELPFRAADGVDKWVRTVGRPEVADGRVVRIVGNIMDITDRKRAEEERLRLVGEVRGLAARLAAVQEDERRMLARELHDRVGQGLTSLGLTLDMIRSVLPEGPRRLVSDRLSSAVEVVGQTMTQVRDVMGELRPPMLDEFGLLPTLVWWAGEFGARSGVVVDVRGAESDPRLGVEIELALFRIVQEALTNVVRHAGATAATILVTSGGGAVTVEVVDQGRGFDTSETGSPGARERWGIAIMRERALAVGAKLGVDSAPGQGTRIVVTVPR